MGHLYHGYVKQPEGIHPVSLPSPTRFAQKPAMFPPERKVLGFRLLPGIELGLVELDGTGRTTSSRRYPNIEKNQGNSSSLIFLSNGFTSFFTLAHGFASKVGQSKSGVRPAQVSEPKITLVQPCKP